MTNLTVSSSSKNRDIRLSLILAISASGFDICVTVASLLSAVNELSERLVQPCGGQPGYGAGYNDVNGKFLLCGTCQKRAGCTADGRNPFIIDV